MASNVQVVTSLGWLEYQGSTKNLFSQTVIDLISYTSWSFTTSGPIPNALGAQPANADGLNIDNTGNKNAVTVTVSNGFTETIPAYTKATIILGGGGAVSISGGGICTATFYKGIYPGAIAQQDVLSATLQAIGVYLPPAIMFYYGGPVGNVPAGYLFCDGSAISRTTYSALFAAIGTTYGAGDGASTFNLPNTCDNFIRGFNPANARALGSYQADAVASHWHYLPFTIANKVIYMLYNAAKTMGIFGGSGGGPLNAFNYGNGTEVSGPLTYAQSSTDIGGYGTANDGTSNGSETRPKNLNIPMIIKY